MAKTRSETIILQGAPNLVEGEASVAILPGQHIIFGGAKDYTVGGANHGKALRIATENDLVGKTIADTYAADEQVYAHAPRKNDVVQVRLPAAAAAIVKGDLLEAAASGNFIKNDAGVALLEAQEAVDNSGGGTTVLINARVL